MAGGNQVGNGFVIPSEARDLGFSGYQQEPRFLALLGMTNKKAGSRLATIARVPAAR
jgi:hypothetical protein